MDVIELASRVVASEESGDSWGRTPSHYGDTFFYLFDNLGRALGVLAALGLILLLFIGVTRSIDDLEKNARDSWRGIKIEDERGDSSEYKRATGVYAQVRPSAAGINPTLYRRKALASLGFIPSYMLLKWIYCSVNSCRGTLAENLIRDPIFISFACLAIGAFTLIVWCSFELRRNGTLVRGVVVELLVGKYAYLVYCFDVDTNEGKRRFRCRGPIDSQVDLGKIEGSAILIRYLSRFPRISQIESVGHDSRAASAC